MSKSGRYIVPGEFIDGSRLKSLDYVKVSAFDFGVVILDRELDETNSATFSLDYTPTYPVKTNESQKPVLPVRPIPSSDFHSSDAGAVSGVDFPIENDNYRALVGYPGSQVNFPPTIRVSFCPLVPYLMKGPDDMRHYFYAYKCSTFGGMSGSPILFRESDKSYKIVGIHSGGPNDDSFNRGIFINYAVYLRVRYWVNNLSPNDDRDMSTDFSPRY